MSAYFRNQRHTQSGFTVIEIMIALVLGMIITTGIIQIFVSNKAAYNLNEQVARLQETGRFATDFMSRMIRQADYQGCATGVGGNIDNKLNNGTSYLYNFTEGLIGFDAVGDDGGGGSSPTEPGNTIVGAANPAASNDASKWVSGTALTNLSGPVLGSVIEGSDIIVTRGAFGTGVNVVKNNDSAVFFAADIGTSRVCPDASPSASNLCQTDILMVSDCTKSVVFQVANVQVVGGGRVDVNHSKGAPAGMTPGNKSASWGASSKETSFGTDAEIFRVKTTAYYIGVGATGPALFMRDDSEPAIELVDGVENMQILYGVDTDGNGVPNTYVSARDVADFENVISIRIGLLVRSVNEFAVDAYTNTPTILGTTYDPVDDNRLRAVYETTIRLRNRGL
ncbi:PilW family protein [Sedimenticola sp.]|uniref:PilW family protein n=1 Tax=Sedimenticola sp. TaxID=1940285 RepID=UPI003D1183F7